MIAVRRSVHVLLRCNIYKYAVSTPQSWLVQIRPFGGGYNIAQSKQSLTVVLLCKRLLIVTWCNTGLVPFSHALLRKWPDLNQLRTGSIFVLQ